MAEFEDKVSANFLRDINFTDWLGQSESVTNNIISQIKVNHTVYFHSQNHKQIHQNIIFSSILV